MLKLPYDENTIMFNNPYYPVFLKSILKNIKGSKEIYDIHVITATSWEKPKYETKWENELNLDVDRFWWKLHNRAIFKLDIHRCTNSMVSIQNCSQNFNYKCIFEKNWNCAI